MDSNEDEEISIDFGKIKNFFKKEGRKEKRTEESSEPQKEKTEDDELTIDFGKIKKFFKSEEKAEDTAKEGGREDEIAIDFGKIKKIFSSGEETKGEELQIDWGKAIDFFKRYGIVFIALIPLIFSIYVRMQAESLPITDRWAVDSVVNNIKSQIRAGIDQQYPNLPDANKDALVDAEFQKVISQNNNQIDEQIKATSNYFKSFFQDESGKRYMPDIDPYYWFRYSKNIVEHGHPGDILKDGRPFDTYQLAPLGRFVFPDMFHSYASAYFYKALHFFKPGLELMDSMFYLVIFFSMLCVLLVFLIGRKIAGNTGGFFAAAMLAVNGAFLSRTLHPDNDVWVVFFPLLITWLFVSTIELRNTLKIALITAIAGFFTGLFTLAWSGWWYIFDFLLATIGLTFAYLVFANFNEIKRNARYILADTSLRNLILIGLLYFFSTAVFVALFSGWGAFWGSFIGPLSFPSIKAPVSAGDLFPNVLTTVAELNEGSIDGIINSIGGKFLFFISLLGVVLSVSRADGIKKFDFAYSIAAAMFYGLYFLLKNLGFDISIFGLLVWIMVPVLARIGISVYKKDSSYDFKLSILLSLWIVSTIFASIKGIRFTLLLAPAFSVAFGAALGKSYSYASMLLTKEFKIHKAVSSSILIVLLLLVYVNPTRGAISAAGSDLPIINDAWYNALIAINQNSSENAIITSWWDFGHHFKAIADRRVTFDGTTQTTPAAHWVGKLLMTSDERQAMGILRMLDCGSNRAFNALYKTNNDTHLSIKLLNDIILLDKEDAEKKLEVLKFDKKQIENIISFTHCEPPPEAYFIASEDMIGKSGVWGHFGSWSFERADLWINARRMPQENAVEYMMKKFNYTREMAENTYFEMQAITSDSEANTWIAPWPGYGGATSCGKNDNGLYICGNGLQINLSSHDVFASSQQGIVRPRAAAFTTEDGILKKEFNGSTLDLGMTIIPKSENELEAVMSSKELTGGMFTRMFYMRGHGLKYFKLFNHQRGLTGTDIYVYKVDWEGGNSTIVEEYGDFLSQSPKYDKESDAIKNLSEPNSTNAS